MGDLRWYKLGRYWKKSAFNTSLYTFVWLLRLNWSCISKMSLCSFRVFHISGVSTTHDKAQSLGNLLYQISQTVSSQHRAERLYLQKRYRSDVHTIGSLFRRYCYNAVCPSYWWDNLQNVETTHQKAKSTYCQIRSLNYVDMVYHFIYWQRPSH